MRFNAKTAHVAAPESVRILLDETAVSRTPGMDVESMDQIGEDAIKMAEALAQGGFPGKYKQAFAIAHQQVRNPHYRFFVVNRSAADAFGGHTLILNPQIANVEGKTELKREFCLTHPYKHAKTVQRHEAVDAMWIDKDLKIVRMRLEGIAAQVFQHEVDHCDGRTVWIEAEEQAENNEV